MIPAGSLQIARYPVVRCSAGFGPVLLLTEHQIHNPAAPNMRAGSPFLANALGH